MGETTLTGSGGVGRFARDVSELLDQRTEKFAGLQLVPVGPLPAAAVWCDVGKTQTWRRSFTKSTIQQLNLSTLMGLELRDLPQVPGRTETETC